MSKPNNKAAKKRTLANKVSHKTQRSRLSSRNDIRAYSTINSSTGNTTQDATLTDRVSIMEDLIKLSVELKELQSQIAPTSTANTVKAKVTTILGKITQLMERLNNAPPISEQVPTDSNQEIQTIISKLLEPIREKIKTIHVALKREILVGTSTGHDLSLGEGNLSGKNDQPGTKFGSIRVKGKILEGLEQLQAIDTENLIKKALLNIKPRPVLKREGNQVRIYFNPEKEQKIKEAILELPQLSFTTADKPNPMIEFTDYGKNLVAAEFLKQLQRKHSFFFI